MKKTNKTILIKNTRSNTSVKRRKRKEKKMVVQMKRIQCLQQLMKNESFAVFLMMRIMMMRIMMMRIN